MATISKTHQITVDAPAEVTWTYIVWELWPNLATNMHSPHRDDAYLRFGFKYGKGSGRAEGGLAVTPLSPTSCSLTATWQVFDVGFVVAAALGRKTEGNLVQMASGVKVGAEARARQKGR